MTGVAFRLDPAHVDEVLRHLDHREKNGYVRQVVALHGDDGARFAEAVLFVATEDNPNFLGPAPFDALVAQIAAAAGPSGTNREYVLELARALRELGAPDAHVEEISAALVSSHAA